MAQTVQEMHMETDRKVGEVFRTMILFTIVMVLGPISTYFLTKNYVWESLLSVSKENSYIYSALSAVLVVHIIVGTFIYVAWKDANSAAYAKKQD